MWLRRHPFATCAEKQNVVMLASAVSSKMLKAMGRKEGFDFEETLTGFKWMGNRTAELRAEGREVIMAYEEAIGFCTGDVVKDKDGVAAASVFLEMASFLRREEGLSPYQKLSQLYRTYGQFYTADSYVKCLDPEVTARLFSLQAELGGKGLFPTGEMA